MTAYAYMAGNDEKQRAAFIKLGVAEGNIFADAGESGAAWKRLLRRLRKGDTLYIHSLDALGINVHEILIRWRALTKEKGIDIAVLASPLIDTRIGKDLTGSLVADVVSEILLFAANDEHERQLLRQRNGIERAKKRGVHCGRAPRVLPDNFDEVGRMWRRGEISAAEAARRCGMAVSTFRYHANKL
ncbi:MAG: recombinase family protein [Clostridia bacterium]|nr:recombinase family protein [Clostridia bacterium]